MGAHGEAGVVQNKGGVCPQAGQGCVEEDEQEEAADKGVILGGWFITAFKVVPIPDAPVFYGKKHPRYNGEVFKRHDDKPFHTCKLRAVEHLFHVFGNHVHLYIHHGAGGVRVHDGALPSVRGNPELQLCGVCMNGGNGEGDAVYANAAFVDGVA